MARTKTRSNTKTRTEPRIIFLERQVQLALRNIGFDSERIKPILGGIRKRYFRSIKVIGLGEDGLCRAQLTILIDWVRFQVHVAAGRDTVRISADEHTAENEVEASVDAFNDLVETLELKPSWEAYFVDGIDGKRANEELGLAFGKSVEWAVGQRMSIGGALMAVDEMSVRVEAIVEQEGAAEEDDQMDDYDEDYYDDSQH